VTAAPKPPRGLTEVPTAIAIRAVSLLLLLWALFSEVGPGTAGAHPVAWVLMACVVPVWIIWPFAPSGSRARRLVAFAWLSVVGGALTAYAPIALVVVGAAALGAAAFVELPLALAVGALSPAAFAVTALAASRSASLVLSTGAVSLAGLVLGVVRRQATERARQAGLLAVERDRAEVERERASVLADRNRLAREMHDVLAHTLGALLVQLEALDAQLEGAEDAPASVRQGLERTRALAADGLVEARRAVQALRDDVEPVDGQLRKLCELRGARLDITGSLGRLSPEATLALYRVAQESLTNAAKHAPGAPLRVQLDAQGGAVALRVTNGAPAGRPGPIAMSGGGYGLDGIRERVRLLGGEVTAGPQGDGWVVEARLPT
jgi:signal transduction histidine kinase